MSIFFFFKFVNSPAFLLVKFYLVLSFGCIGLSDNYKQVVYFSWILPFPPFLFLPSFVEFLFSSMLYIAFFFFLMGFFFIKLYADSFGFCMFKWNL